MVSYEGLRQHGLPGAALMISLAFALVGFVTPEWLLVGKKGSYIGVNVCCSHGGWYFWIIDIVMFAALIVQILYVLYLIISIGIGICPQIMTRADLAVSVFITLIYLFVAIFWLSTALADYDSKFPHMDVFPGYSYYFLVVGLLFSLAASVISIINVRKRAC